MDLVWITELIKSQGVALGAFIVILFVLVKFFQKVLNNSQEREEMLTKLLTNHLGEFAKTLNAISENLRKTSEEHSEMIKLLIKIAERTKHGN